MKQVVTIIKIQYCIWILKILRGSTLCGLLQKVTQMRLKHLYPWLKRTFFRTLVEKESHRIYRCKIGEKNVLFNKDSDKIMRLQNGE